MREAAAASDTTFDFAVALRGAVGGVLMGLANLVPGISGGTMLLAAGVYPEFISAVADLTILRIRRRAVLLLAAVIGAAALSILLLAGVVKDLVITHRWVMYSLFIGLTLGGIPLVWRLARRLTTGVLLGSLAGLAVMLVMAGGIDTVRSDAGPNYVLLTVSGLVGASAMILPGISGGYLLLLLGQYEPILGAVDRFKVGLLGSPGLGPDLGVALDALKVLGPVGIGLVVGVVGMSNLVRWLLVRFEKQTLGVLLGLLAGAVVGLWPFQRGARPNPGDVLDGVLLAADDIARLEPENWPVQYFDPSAGQVVGAVLLVALGLVVTTLIDRLGRGHKAPRGDEPVQGHGS